MKNLDLSKYRGVVIGMLLGAAIAGFLYTSTANDEPVEKIKKVYIIVGAFYLLGSMFFSADWKQTGDKHLLHASIGCLISIFALLIEFHSKY